MPAGRKVYKLVETVYKNRDKIYAGLTGTAAGIGLSIQDNDLYDMWRNKHPWNDPFKPKKGKGEFPYLDNGEEDGGIVGPSSSPFYQASSPNYPKHKHHIGYKHIHDMRRCKCHDREYRYRSQRR